MQAPAWLVWLTCVRGGRQVDPAAFEISGHIIFKRAEDYEAASQASVWRLLAHASLSEDEFLATARLALDF